ncbi:MAG TPA: ABC transporter permease [Trebonia sp.]|nr:ABC transporter permease [Trebonia sp.]
MRQAVFIAVGLALGIGLVITVTAASAGVKNAQSSVLHSLYGVGTDITVTKAPAAGSGGPQSFGFGFRAGTAKRPAAGTKIDVENLRSTGLGTISSSDVSMIAAMKDVAAAAGGLTLLDTKITGTMPAINFNNGGGPGSFGGGGGFQNFRSSFTPTSFTVDGVDIGSGELGPLSNGKLVSGATFTGSDTNAHVAVLDSDYATSQKLKAGDTITVDKTSFKVIGIVSEPAGANPADVYIPLGVAQSLSGLKNDVNTIYVAATSGQEITSVADSITKAVPGASITDQSSLASQVTGSITSAASLADNLGRWLAIAVLAAAFGLASLLTMSAVSRRIREFGTLKALGWRSRRVIGQVMGESIAIGIVGGAVGVGLGFLGAALVDKFTTPLTATVGTDTGSATPGGSRFFGGGGGGAAFGGASPFRGGFQSAARAADTVAVHLSAPVTIAAVAAAVGLAILGGLIAGSFGGWRAARLRPAAALSKVA